MTQDDLALRIAGLRPGEAPFLQPLGADPQVVFIMPHLTMWLISRELSGPVPVPWGSVFQAVPVQAGEKISRFPKTACSTPTVHTRSAAPQQYIHVRWQAAMSDSIPLQDAQLARDSANLTTLFFRSSGHYNTDPAIRTGGLVRRFRSKLIISLQTTTILDPRPHVQSENAKHESAHASWKVTFQARSTSSRSTLSVPPTCRGAACPCPLALCRSECGPAGVESPSHNFPWRSPQAEHWPGHR